MCNMYILVFFAITALANASRSCTEFCKMASSGHLSGVWRPECRCDSGDQINLKMFNTDHNGLRTPIIKDNPTFIEPVEISPYSLSFLNEPFYIIKPIKFKTEKQDLVYNKRVAKKNKEVNGSEKKNIIHEVDFETEEFPLYLDIDIYKTKNHVEPNVKLSKIENVNIQELETAINECIQLQISVNSRKVETNLRSEWYGDKYNVLSDSDLMTQLKEKCDLPIRIVNESIEEIKMSLPKKNASKTKLSKNKDLRTKPYIEDPDIPSQKDDYEMKLHTNGKSITKSFINSRGNQRMLTRVPEILDDPYPSTTVVASNLIRENAESHLAAHPAINLFPSSTSPRHINKTDDDVVSTLRDLVEARTTEKYSNMFSTARNNNTFILNPNVTSPSKTTVEPISLNQMQMTIVTPRNNSVDILYPNSTSSYLFASDEIDSKEKERDETSLNINKGIDGVAPKSIFKEMSKNNSNIEEYANNIFKQHMNDTYDTEDVSIERSTMVPFSEKNVNNDFIFTSTQSIPVTRMLVNSDEDIETTMIPDQLLTELFKLESVSTSNIEKKLHNTENISISDYLKLETINKNSKNVIVEDNNDVQEVKETLEFSDRINGEEKKYYIDRNTESEYSKFEVPNITSTELEGQSNKGDYVDIHTGLLKPTDEMNFTQQYNKIKENVIKETTEHYVDNTEFTVSTYGDQSLDFFFDEASSSISNKASHDRIDMEKVKVNVREINTMTYNKNSLMNETVEALNSSTKREEYYQNDLLLPKILTTEYANDTVVSVINGTEILGQNANESNNNYKNGDLKNHDGKVDSAEIVGNLAFIFENHTIPARFVQTSDGQMKLAIEGLTICQQITKSSLSSSLLLSALCKCSSATSENC